MKSTITIPGKSHSFFESVLYIFFLLLPSLVSSQETLMGLTSNGGVEGKGTAFTIQTNATDFKVVKLFTDWGKNPNGALIKGNDGNYYGMTFAGGTYNFGTIFNITPAGIVTVLHHFNGVTDGANPTGSLTLGVDGNFYGLTNIGGANQYGTIFKLTAAGVFSVIRSFSYGTDGANPNGQMVIALDGNFYGITRRGGSTGNGTIFKLTPAGVFTVIKTLSAIAAIDGAYCYGSLAAGIDGNLYGSTSGGGTNGNGTIFKVTPAGVYTVLRQINQLTDGYSNRNGLVQAADGFLYGTNYAGGKYGHGTIYKISAAGIFSVLRHLAYATDGSGPAVSLVIGTDGNFYGMNKSGGAFNNGTIFKITPAGIYTVLRSLKSATDGGFPFGSLLKGIDGNFYGMTSEGGTNFFGTAFKITPTGVFTLLTSFNGGITGNEPLESLVQDAEYGYLGTSAGGGVYNNGTIFRICGDNYKVVRSLNKPTDGGTPKGTLLLAKDGNFYGTTSDGGTSNSGTIFKLTPAGVYTVIHHLVGFSEGSFPQGSLVQGTDGNLYGTTRSGGTGGVGTVFKVTTAGILTVLRHISAVTDGGNPEGGLVQGTGDYFFGMTTGNGAIFKITSAGVFTILKKLSSLTDGNSPTGDLIRATDGNYYGTTSAGGTFAGGTIFKISEAGVFKVMKQLNPAVDGSLPKGSLVQATDGILYGLTSAGGTNKSGTIFKMTTAGVFSVMKHLNLKTEGGNASGSLIVQKKLLLIANPQTVVATEDVAKPIVLTGTGATPLIYTVVTPPRNGTVTAGTTANRVYTGASNYAGRDSFYFVVTFGCVTSLPAKVSLTVTPVNNDAPVLDSIKTKFVRVNTLLTFTAKATEYDSGQTKTFSLITPPAGATIDAKTGIFKWIPTAVGVVNIKVRVSDNGIPVLNDEEQVSVTIATNFAPVLKEIGNKNIKPGLLFTFTASATDIDIGQTKTFSLITPPAGATIDPLTGVFKWTPAAVGVVVLKVRVTDNGTPPLYDEESITISVATNFAPVLNTITAKIVKVGLPVTFTATATDIDAGQTKTYSLVTPPTGATIDPLTGVFKWTPATVGVVILKLRVTDNGVPVLYDEDLISVTVVSNFAPVLNLIGNKIVQVALPMTFTAISTDPDAGQTKTFSLLTPPAGATIDPKTGVFKWTPAAIGVFKLKVRVTDNGVPILYDEEEISITVKTTLRSITGYNEVQTAREQAISAPVVYPNPVSGRCIVELDGPVSVISAVLLDINGAAVMNWSARRLGNGKLELDLSRISRGQYVVVVNDNERRWVVKVIKL